VKAIPEMNWKHVAEFGLAGLIVIAMVTANGWMKAWTLCAAPASVGSSEGWHRR
jgi:hypothetical protein